MLDVEVDDDVLVARARAGETAAFDVLARRYRGWLVAQCLPRVGGDHHQAEDVAQECLIRLHATLTRDDRELRVRAWLAVVARHLCIDHARRRVPQPVETVPDTAVQDEDPFDLDPALAQAWSRLAPRHREALTHRELVGLSYDEIALVMNTTVPAVETLLFRARASLRAHYRKAGGRLLGCGAFLLGLDRLARGSEADTHTVAHVATCPPCTAALHQIEAVGQVLRGLTPPPPPRTGLIAQTLDRLSQHATLVMNTLTTYGGQVGTAVTAAAVAISPVAAPPATSPVRPVVARPNVTAPPVPSHTPRTAPVAGPAMPSPVAVTASPSHTHWWQDPWSPKPAPTWSPKPAPTWQPPLFGPYPTPSAATWPSPAPEPTRTQTAPWR